eukprot:scaffold75545_cov31-Tisochrysis_lutea.AAC.3
MHNAHDPGVIARNTGSHPKASPRGEIHSCISGEAPLMIWMDVQAGGCHPACCPAFASPSTSRSPSSSPHASVPLSKDTCLCMARLRRYSAVPSSTSKPRSLDHLHRSPESARLKAAHWSRALCKQ